MTFTATTEVANSPITTWVTIGVGVVVILAMAVPKVLGPISKGISTWAENQRRRSAESEDARIADMNKDITYLKGAVVELRTTMRDRDRLAMQHMVWDHQMIIRLQKQASGAYIEEPPPLFPVAETAEEATDN